MNVFFNRLIGPRKRAIQVTVDRDDGSQICLDPDGDKLESFPHHLEPADAKALGRALIKAAKFAEKGKAK